MDDPAVKGITLARAQSDSLEAMSKRYNERMTAIQVEAFGEDEESLMDRQDSVMDTYKKNVRMLLTDEQTL